MDVTNNYHFLKCGFKVGEPVFYKADVRFVATVKSETRVLTHFGDKTESVSLTKAHGKVRFLETGEVASGFFAPDEWVDSEGVTLTDRAFAYNQMVSRRVKNNKTKTLGKVSVDYKTVYSHLRSADDVVTTDVPEAVGHKEGEAFLWKDYLAGGEGASRRNHKLVNLEVKDEVVSACCVKPLRETAGFVWCSECGHEAVRADHYATPKLG